MRVSTPVVVVVIVIVVIIVALIGWHTFAGRKGTMNVAKANTPQGVQAARQRYSSSPMSQPTGPASAAKAGGAAPGGGGAPAQGQ